MHLEIARLARNSLIYGAGQIFTRFVTILLLPVFTAYLTPADYGVSSILSLMTFFLTPVFGLGLSIALGMVYFGQNVDRDEKDASIWTAFSILVVSGLTLVVLSVIFEPALVALLFPGADSGYDYGYLLIVVVATAALSIICQPLLVYLQLEDRAPSFVVLTVASALATIGLSVLMVVGLRRGIQGMLEASLLGQAITLALALIPALTAVKLRIRAGLVPGLLRLGIPLIPSFLSVFVMLQVNKYVIQVDHGLAEVGIYTIGFNFGLFMQLLTGGFTNAWYPFVMSYLGRERQASVLFGRIFTYYLLGFGALTLLFYMAARPGVLILTHGVAYREAYVVVGPSATAQMLIGAHSILLGGMYLAKKVQHLMVVQVIAAVCAVFLNIILIPPLGITGASIAVVGGFLIMVVAQYLWNRHAHYLTVEYEWSRIGRYCALYTAYALFFSSTRDWPLAVEIAASVLGTLGMMAYMYWLLLPTERAFVLSLPGRLRSRRLLSPPSEPTPEV